MNEQDRFEEVKDHVNVVVESLRGDIRVLAEGHTSVTAAIEVFRAGQDELRGKVEHLSVGQAVLRAGQDELRAGQDELRGDMRQLSMGLRQEMSEFRTEVREGFRSVRAAVHASNDRLGERVERVERDVAVLKKQVKALGPRKGRS
jgi:chromosome segregation ATPase